MDLALAVRFGGKGHPRKLAEAQQHDAEQRERDAWSELSLRELVR
jgi:hypothetical protein